MADTPILKILQVASNQNNKEVTINDGILSLENATQNSLAVSFAAGNVTLTTDQFVSHFTFICTGLTAARTLTVPLQKRAFTVINNDDEPLTVGGATGAAVRVLGGGVRIIFCDGTDCYSPDTPYELKCTYPVTPAANALMLGDYVTRNIFWLPAFAGSRFYCEAAPTSDYDIDIKKNASSIGTIHFAAGANVATITSAGGTYQTAVSGDRVRLIGSATPDPTFAGFYGTLAGGR